ncbi:hypothetical protein ABFS82_05G040300 [Erythranthe guttata]|uniref:Uncharacterized protein n=1 Tax=Erythranthe guttata TaxID=4155 RepID=A0A022QQ45_ERYGU|nr:PREDICTED: uncharacterized protein LOC105966161 [Erythranthe guttata]EYU30056.1 hypothetical protein MIMGU_mgv1a015064mg [Erythranthe guttata]|eukprot:XP_012846178.1 PREDICTED: uncharacterized protein LOC105966161 [Erythranthe guttata]
MSFTTLKPVTCRIPPVNGSNGPYTQLSRVTMMNRQALPPLQVKAEKEKQELQEKRSTATKSRREIMHLTTVSLGLAALLPPPPAEARARNATMRQKIMQKFEELRQKAGLSKSTKEEAEQEYDEEEKKPKAEIKDKSNVKETTLPPKEELSVPTLPGIMNGTIVETTLP